ncbi:molybdenum cofactor biosysynthesis protein [Rhodococcus sp. BP-316]|jgi:MOSC domain-containing protein YiiM|uniref:molybdenum cofactor biosysynthesis protein n=1 Tax=unclassified Rhodococcus (in: high G+C Gram-positive bacteria) TaxID=192944 RepID=UPI001C9A46DF|nr:MULTISPECIES: molybdenum cofactor biosysynthesis protein [unclassified Rhodococcus (in: high G+C Gram-positive bacteria)]MBY6683670.1 molybdenum cofactor biosysynthesis protein [Rhodococcus sp. BP-316]
MTFTCPIEIVQLLVSPSHAYFGRSKDGPAADVRTQLPSSVEVVTGKGIRGDRFFGVQAHTEAAITFLAVEAWETAVAEANALHPDDEPWDGDVSVARRNIVVRGLELDPLRGEDFVIDTGDGPVLLRGGRPAHPCAWMDSMVVDGTRKALIGRGGLRTAPISSGTLRVGPGVVISPVPLDPERAALSVRRAQPLPRG